MTGEFSHHDYFAWDDCLLWLDSEWLRYFDVQMCLFIVEEPYVVPTALVDH